MTAIETPALSWRRGAGTRPPAPVLSIRGLNIDFTTPDGISRGVQDLDLDLAPGEVLALVGETGSGKTATAKAVLGLLPDAATVRGSVRLAGQEVVGLDEEQLRPVRGSQAAMIFQEPATALNPVQTTGWQLREALRAHRRPDGRRWSRAEARTRAVELLDLVGIPDPVVRVNQYPHQLSGGQRQRVVIALALANEPRLLIADEPTTALDVTVQAEILRLLRDLSDRLGTAVLLITHNLGVVAELADRVVVLRDGRLVEQAGVDDLFAAPRADYTRALIAAVPRLLPAARTPLPATSRPEARAPGEGGPDVVLQISDAVLRYPTRTGAARRSQAPALDGVGLTLGRAEVLGLVGESGSGKTTLGRLAVGLLRPDSGRVELFGSSLAGASRPQLAALRRQVGVIFQDPATSLDPRFDVAASIAEPLHVHRVGDRASRAARVRELLDQVQLAGTLATRRPHELSGGQRQRVALARALALAPRLLVADEPTSALDVSVQAAVLELFRELQSELGFAALFISHDLAVIDEISDRVLVLRGGRQVETGPTAQVLRSPSSAYTRALLDAVPEPDPALGRARRARLAGDAPPDRRDSSQVTAETSDSRQPHLRSADL